MTDRHMWRWRRASNLQRDHGWLSALCWSILSPRNTTRWGRPAQRRQKRPKEIKTQPQMICDDSGSVSIHLKESWWSWQVKGQMTKDFPGMVWENSLKWTRKQNPGLQSYIWMKAWSFLRQPVDRWDLRSSQARWWAGWWFGQLSVAFQSTENSSVNQRVSDPNWVMNRTFFQTQQLIDGLVKDQSRNEVAQRTTVLQLHD